MLPKLLDVPISTYLIVLAKIRRPSTTPSASTPRSFSSRMTSAASWATSVAVSTEIPTSAACSARASFTPSPRKPTSRPSRRSSRTTRAFCSGRDPGEAPWSARAAAASASSSRASRSRSGERRSGGRARAAAQTFCGHQRVVPRGDLDGDAERRRAAAGSWRRCAWAGPGRRGTRRACRSRSSASAPARRGVDRPAGDGHEAQAGAELLLHASPRPPAGTSRQRATTASGAPLVTIISGRRPGTGPGRWSSAARGRTAAAAWRR